MSQTPSLFASPGAQLNDCWKKIGVWGNGACPELEKFIHCRNCPVYSAAAVQLLDVPPPEGYLGEWAERLAVKKDTAGAASLSVIIFRLGMEWFALTTTVLSEVAEHRSIHSLPLRRNSVVLGVVNVRGELLVCVSIARVLQSGWGSDTEILTRHRVFGRLLVVRSKGRRLAFPVDEVHGLHHFHPEQVQPAPQLFDTSVTPYTRGLLPWNSQNVVLLEDQLLLYTFNRSLA